MSNQKKRSKLTEMHPGNAGFANYSSYNSVTPGWINDVSYTGASISALDRGFYGEEDEDAEDSAEQAVTEQWGKTPCIAPQVYRGEMAAYPNQLAADAGKSDDVAADDILLRINDFLSEGEIGTMSNFNPENFAINYGTNRGFLREEDPTTDNAMVADSEHIDSYSDAPVAPDIIDGGIDLVEQKQSYGCAMLSIDIDLSLLQKHIKSYDVYVDVEAKSGDYTGLVSYPHITLLYGILDGVTEQDVASALAGIKFDDVWLHNITMFENDDYDVLVYSAESESLLAAHEALCAALPYSSTYPDYKPHCTISYLKKGCGKEYVQLFQDINDMAQPINVRYNSADDIDCYLPIQKKISEEVVYNLFAGTTIAPVNSANPQINSNMIDAKQSLYNNGGKTQTLDTFLAAARQYAGTSPTMAYDGTVPLQDGNPAYSEQVTPEGGAYSMQDNSNLISTPSAPQNNRSFINGKPVEESAVSGTTTSSSIANPAPAVLTGAGHAKEQHNRIKRQLGNFDGVDSELLSGLNESASKFIVSFLQDTEDYAIMVSYLDKSCVFTLGELLDFEQDMLNYVSDSLVNAFYDVAAGDDIRLIPDVAAYVRDNMHEAVIEHKKKLKEGSMINRNQRAKGAKLNEAAEDANNIIANEALCDVVSNIASRRSEFGEDYEYLTPDAVAAIALNDVGMQDITYNQVTAIATNIKELVEMLPNSPVDAEQTEVVADVDVDNGAEELTAKGVTVESLIRRGKMVRGRISEAQEKNKTVAGWAKELGKPYSEIHKYWLKAEKAADKKLPEKQYWSEVNSIAQRMIGAKYGEFKPRGKVQESRFYANKKRRIAESVQAEFKDKNGAALFELYADDGIVDKQFTATSEQQLKQKIAAIMKRADIGKSMSAEDIFKYIYHYADVGGIPSVDKDGKHTIATLHVKQGADKWLPVGVDSDYAHIGDVFTGAVKESLQKSNSLKESAPKITAQKSNCKLKLVVESLGGLEVELKSTVSVKGGADLIAGLLDMAGLLDDDFYMMPTDVIGFDDTVALAVDGEVYVAELPLVDDVIGSLAAGNDIDFDLLPDFAV